MSSPPALLPSLARAIRGLSALFWGLPVSIFLWTNLALGTPGGSRHLPLGGTVGNIANTISAVMPACMALGLLIYGLALLGAFQPRERIWIHSLERARLLVWLNLALTPFAYWFSRRPDEPFFAQSFQLGIFAHLAFLVCVNHVIRRLAAMLPDETLRSDVRIFTALNIRALVALGSVLALALVIGHSRATIAFAGPILGLLGRIEPWQLVVPALIPVALTMTLLWKTKGVIISSVFGVSS